HVVGLPRRQLPQELRHAHRPPAADVVRRRKGHRDRDRPGGAQGQAHPLGPRAARARPRRAGQAVRSGLGRRRGANRRSRRPSAALRSTLACEAYRPPVARRGRVQEVDIPMLERTIRRLGLLGASAALFAACAGGGGSPTTAPVTAAPVTAAPVTAAPATQAAAGLTLAVGTNATLGSYVTGANGMSL